MTIVGVVAVCLLLFAGGSATTFASTVSGASARWGTGIEAVLPANAATGANQDVSINSVSCPSQGYCSAVGRYRDNSGIQEGLLLTETAGKWAAGVEAVLPANASNGANQSVTLNSVSCPSVGNCSAVGTYSDGLSRRWGLLLMESAGIWAAGVEATLPANAATTFQAVVLASVSCPTAGNCSAVGAYLVSTGTPVFASPGLLLTEVDGSWAKGSESALPANASTGANQSVTLSSVSCHSPGNCTAVGSYVDSSGDDQGLLLTETAGSWAPGTEATLPANASANQSVTLNSVSCPSAGNCSAVGNYLDRSGDDQGLLLTERGSWGAGSETVLPANAATTFQAVVLASISCRSPEDCSAVGNYFDRSDNIEGLLLTKRVGKWATGVEPFLPANAAHAQQFTLLNSVSCASTGNCSAVGTYVDRSGGSQGLLLTEAAVSWATAVQAPLPSNADGAELASVSCSSGNSCIGVGSYGTSSGSPQGLLMAIIPPPLVSLDISKSGRGTGTVMSSPAGLVCGTACSHAYPAGTRVTLTATPAANSSFGEWLGSCTGRSTCTVAADKDRTITVIFGLNPPPCLVPNLRGETLTAAKRSIASHHCSLGRIKHAISHTTTRGHVISQRPRPGRRLKHGAKVNLVESDGP